MDTSSTFAASPVSLSQLLAHIRAADQTEAFVQEVIYKSPARSVATTRAPSFVSRSSKRSGFIVSKRSGFSSDSDSDNDETATAITCSSIGSVSQRTIGGAAARKRSLHSGWFDEEEELSESDSDDSDASTIAQRAASRARLTPSKRSLENLKNMSMFDPSFSFSRTCVTSPVTEVSPLDSLFF